MEELVTIYTTFTGHENILGGQGWVSVSSFLRPIERIELTAYRTLFVYFVLRILITP